MKELLFTSLTSLFSRQESVTSIDYNAAPPNLSTLANNSLFETWRPKAHVLPPHDHVGDPCMHYTDPKTGLFHVGYLYTQGGPPGGAGAKTDDFVTYHDVNPDVPVFIWPGGKNDPLAVFDGSVIPDGIDGNPTLLYTSISYLPLHWTIPYIKGSETQSLAVSSDGGSNFTKVAQGPVIPGSPYGSVAINTTGFRDPFVFQSPQFDQTYHSEEGTWYTIVSGGVHDIGPSQFLYRQYNPEFRDWEYLGEWWKQPANSTWGDGTWAGRWGFNFECGNVFFLSEQGYDDEGDIFITLGSEWGYKDTLIPQTSPERNMLWTSGRFKKSHHYWGESKFEPEMAGRLDWGRSAYAAAGKLVPASSQASQKSGAEDRYMMYLWLSNDEYGNLTFPIHQQGWDASLTTLREVSKGRIPNVVDNDLAREVGSWRSERNDANCGTVDLITLKQEIAREAYAAYTKNATRSFSQAGRTVSSNEENLAFSESPNSRFYLMTASLSFPPGARGSDTKAGFEILKSEHESTTIYYQFKNESLIIDRSHSSAASSTTDGIATSSEAGRLRLFDIKTSEKAPTHIEKLDLTIIVDNGVLEVYANDRFVMSTWVWTWYAASNQISFFHEGSHSVEFGETHVYEGLVDAWPDRT